MIRHSRVLVTAFALLFLLAGCAGAANEDSGGPAPSEERPMSSGSTELATLGGGCFWCLEAVYERIEGVGDVVSGYSGGHVDDPTYEQVTSKKTGHAEVVQVHFDPDTISYREILEIFFAMHDPTTLNRQGADVGPQYRSIILHHSDEQKRTAEAVMNELGEENVFDDPIVTELAPYEAFWKAEAEHQDFYRNNPQWGYCRVVISPKVAKLRETYREKLKPEYR